MSKYEAEKNRLRAGQVLAGILHAHPGSANGAPPAQSRARAADNDASTRKTPVMLERRPSLWERLIAALGDEFPRSETRPGVATREWIGMRHEDRHAR